MPPVKKIEPETCYTYHAFWESQGWPIKSLCICPKVPENEKPIRLMIHTDVPHICVEKEMAK